MSASQQGVGAALEHGRAAAEHKEAGEQQQPETLGDATGADTHAANLQPSTNPASHHNATQHKHPRIPTPPPYISASRRTQVYTIGGHAGHDRDAAVAADAPSKCTTDRGRAGGDGRQGQGKSREHDRGRVHDRDRERDRDRNGGRGYMRHRSRTPHRPPHRPLAPAARPPINETYTSHGSTMLHIVVKIRRHGAAASGAPMCSMPHYVQYGAGYGGGYAPSNAGYDGGGYEADDAGYDGYDCRRGRSAHDDRRRGEARHASPTAGSHHRSPSENQAGGGGN
jgi:hypothetical protein